MYFTPLFAAVLYSAQILGILLWIGLAVLTVTLVLLMRTRWGQTKPLSKCVGLSVFAHVLFGGYAYGTKLVFDVPQPPTDRVVKLRVVDSANDSADPSDTAHREPKPWEQFVSDADTQVTAAAPKPRMEEAPQLPEESPVEAPPKIAPSPEDLALASEPARPTVERPSMEVPKRTTPAPSDAAPEVKPPERRDDSQAVAPERVKLERIKPTELDNVTKDESVPKLPSELLDTSPRSPTPADAADSSDSPTQITDSGKSGQTIPVTPVARATDSTNDTPMGPTDAVSVPLPRRAADGEQLPSLYQSRVAVDRLGAAKLHGGSARTEAAVEASLKWLAANQSPDGRWDASQHGAGRETRTLGQDRYGAGAEADTGVTGLALLAFLAAGHTHLEGKYRENVQHGLEFLLRSQREDGYLAGKAELFASMYCHGMASLAISEAFAMTGDNRLRPFVERAVRYTVTTQHSASGGWRYQPAEQGDLSQFGWQVMALKSAELAGIDIPDRTKNGMARFLRSVSSGKHRGLASYRAGEGATRTMTAEALACRIFLDVDRDPLTISEGADFVIGDLPKDGKPNLYYWYYGTLSLYQLQDARWQRWNEALQDQLLKRQRTDGELAGSFDVDDMWGGYGGRVYTTAVAALCLEVYYRYLPLIEKAR